MKKQTVVRVLALAMTLLLTACSGPGSAAKSQPETTAAGQSADTPASAAAAAGGNREMLSLSHTNTAESPYSCRKRHIPYNIARLVVCRKSSPGIRYIHERAGHQDIFRYA